MFSIWFLLWLILSAILVYFLGWTLFILFMQKKAWQAYAQKVNLRYVSKRLLTSPEISGTLDGYKVSLFTGEHMTADMRGARKLTAVEIGLSSRMPVSGAVASGGMVEVVQDLQFKEEVRPEIEGWNKAYIAGATHKNVLEAYLTPDRLQALLSLMHIKNSWVILIFKDDVMLLRFDTPDPLDKVEKLERIVSRMLEAAKILELKAGEDKRLKSESLKRSAQEVSLSVADRDLEKAASLKLEDEEE